jgi:hypothetical protein
MRSDLKKMFNRARNIFLLRAVLVSDADAVVIAGLDPAIQAALWRELRSRGTIGIVKRTGSANGYARRRCGERPQIAGEIPLSFPLYARPQAIGRWSP